MSGLLDLLEIRKAYGDTRVLEGVALSLAPGEVVSLLGPSGCGKSTLLRIAAGLDDDFQGTVERNPILGFGPDGENGRSGGIGVVFQEPRLLPWLTVAQNVGFADGWLEDEHWVERLLADVGLAGCGGLLPKQLSGGMAQRAAIARGLYGRPQVLLLDEPFSALDALTRQQLQEELLAIRRRTRITTLLVTHDVSEAVAVADRVILIEDGEIGLDLPVELPRPRSRGSARLAALEAEVLNRVLAQPELPPQPEPVSPLPTQLR